MPLALFIAGAVSYSFVEYATHRWLLHGPLIKHHRVHHKFPNARSRTDLRLLGLAVATIWLILGMSFAMGAFVGWLMSSLFHWRLHVGNLSAPWVLRLREAHAWHHRNPKTNYGVTNMLWDRIFRTKDSQ